VRVIAGTLRGRRLETLPGLDLRPTLDRVREAIFNILQDDVADARVLDLFAGTGALGIEALSRGAASALFVDESPSALLVLKKNLDGLGIAARGSVVRAALPAALSSQLRAAGSFDIIFADPPYRTSLAHETLASLVAAPWFPGWRCVVIETERRVDLASSDAWNLSTGAVIAADRRVYGDTAVTILRPTAGAN